MFKSNQTPSNPNHLQKKTRLQKTLEEIIGFQSCWITKWLVVESFAPDTASMGLKAQ